MASVLHVHTIGTTLVIVGVLDMESFSKTFLVLHWPCKCVHVWHIILNRSVAERCAYSCISHFLQPVYQLPMIRENFTELTCGMWERDGPRTLCSKCIKGHGFPLYTYDLKCVCCTGFYIKELFEFLAKSLISPTILCFVVTVFHLNVLQPPWSVFVLVTQLISSPPIILSSYIFIYIYSNSIWSMESWFFRALYHPKCISPHIKKKQPSLYTQTRTTSSTA